MDVTCGLRVMSHGWGRGGLVWFWCQRCVGGSLVEGGVCRLAVLVPVGAFSSVRDPLDGESKSAPCKYQKTGGEMNG